MVDIQNIIENIKNEQLKLYFKLGNYEISDKKMPVGKSFITKFNKELAELYPNTYEILKDKILSDDNYGYSHLLTDTLRLEHGYYNYKDLSTIKNIPKGMFWWDTEYAKWYFYYKGIEEGYFTFEDVKNFLDNNMEYFDLLVPMFTEKGQEKEYEYLSLLIENAKLEDNIRYTIFKKTFESNSISCVRYFVDKIIERNYFRHKALKEILQIYCNYNSKLESKKIIEIIDDGLNYKCEKYISKEYTYNYVFIKTLKQYRVDKFNEYVKDVLLSNNDKAIIAALSFFTYQRRNHKEEISFQDLMPYIINKDLSFEQLSYFPIFENMTFNKQQAKSLFDYLLPYYDKMDKVNYHFKMTDDIPHAQDLSKTHMIRNLSTLAFLIDNKDIYNLLEQRTTTMGEEALSHFIDTLKDKIETRKYTIQLVKSENYYAKKVYEKSNIVLTFDEAVLVSDYLKTKKESVKRQILGEFYKSKDNQKIANYLINCKEDYKVTIGKELLNKLGIKETKELKEKEEINVKELIKSFYKNTKVKFIKVKNISYNKVVNFYEKLNNFIDKNKDYEYSIKFSDSTYTFGTRFIKFAYNINDSYEYYPLGKELKDEFTNFFTEEELVSLVHYIIDVVDDDMDNDKYYKDKTSNYLKIISKSYAFEMSQLLMKMFLYEFVNKKNLINMIASIYVNEHDFISNHSYGILRISNILETLTKLEDKESLNCWGYLIIKSFENNKKIVNWDVFAKLVENDILDFDLIRNYVFNVNHRRDIFLQRYNDSKKTLSFGSSNYEYPKFKKYMLQFLDEAVDAELNRGSGDTKYSNYITSVSEFYGIKTFLKALNASRSITLVRGSYFWGTAKNENISRILKNTVKIDTDTYEQFEKLVNEYSFTKEELIKACLYNTTYMDYIDKYLNVPNFKLIIYYFIAHLNENISDNKKEIIKQYSVIDCQDFKDGAFDHQWYEEMIKNLSKKDFKIIYDNVKYITVAGLHKRAQRFYDAKNNKITLEECITKISETRNKDYVLIYSLIPLQNEKDLYERFIYIQTFLKESKKYGAQRQASERRAVDIALDNLARLGGYTDTNLFIYEMEASKQIPINNNIVIDDITIQTSFDHLKIVIEAYKDNKLIKLPAKYNKNEQVIEFKELVKENQLKLKRLTKSFEETMCNHIMFTYDNIIKIGKDPIIKYLLSKLILLSDNIVSIYKEDHIEDLNGNIITPKVIYIAHPVELKKNNSLNEAINYIITNNIKQPFKQILREFYTKSDIELTQTSCTRFRGFNVDLKKCISALKSKSWGISEDVGLRKVYYYTNTIAILFREFDDFYIDDYTDYNRELHSITFINRKTEKVIDLKDVDDITFSECLRDVDLMVSISCNAIYDYELAMSTTQMRQEILKSLIQILKLNNVSFLKDNIKIEGHYGNYIVNIRTGLVFMEGKGNLLLDTIYSSNKALLLDFVDEDPMTADIISKALVLSNDKDIKASSILMQIK